MSHSILKKSALSLILVLPAAGVHADGYPFESDRLDSGRAQFGGDQGASSEGSLTTGSLDGARAGGADLAGERAESERREAAIAHYSRARAMLLESLAEFERAREIARPDRLMNPEVFRSSVVTRVQELERVIDPKPRVIESGVILPSEPTLVRAEASGAKNELVHAKLDAVVGGLTKASVQKVKRAKKVITAKKAAPVESRKPARARLLDAPSDSNSATKSALDPMIPELSNTAEVEEPQTAEKQSEVVREVERNVVAEEPAVAKAPVAKAVESAPRIEPLSEEELKARLKNIAADIEASDPGVASGSGGALAVEPAAKN